MRQQPINFVWGKPSPSPLPVSELTLAVKAVIAQPATATDALEYGDPAGPPALRQQVAQWLSGFYDTPNAANEICVTARSSLVLWTLFLCLPFADILKSPKPGPGGGATGTV